MPWRYNNYYYRRYPYSRRNRATNYTTRRRRHFRWRRPRRILRRRPRRRVRRKFYSRYRKRKLKTLKLKQYQPLKINKCKIKGVFALIKCGAGRESRNYAQYQTSIAPPGFPAGGGFSVIKFTLGALFQEHDKWRGWWTKSNLNLDLCRYCYVKIKFYRHDIMDYVSVYSLCYPMLVGKLTYAQCHPSRLLLQKHKIVVPSKKTLPNLKKPYIMKIIKCPSQLINKWFFQKDFSDVGLLMLYTSSCSLDHYYQSTQAKSDTVGIYCLNVNIFQQSGWAEANTTGYLPNTQFTYWGTKNGHTTKPNPTELIPLTGITNTDGNPGNNSDISKRGNLLWHNYIHGSQNVWISKTTTLTTQPTDVTKLQLPLIVECRYNAYNDDGDGNIVYLVSTFKKQNWDPPTTDPDLVFSNFPIWLILWGILDWWQKLRPASQIGLNYILCIRSSKFSPTMNTYIPLNASFINGHGPWETDVDRLDNSTLSHWYPRINFQEQAINLLACSGPATPKPENITGWEAKINYSFLFKWGGCPSSSQDIADPNSQPSYNVPDHLLLKSQAANPKSRTPANTVYAWDYKRDEVTEAALKRYTTDSDSLQSLFTDQPSPSKRRKLSTDPDHNQAQTEIEKILQKTSNIMSQTTETEKETQITQLQLLKQRELNRQLHRHILNLIQQLHKKQITTLSYMAPIQ